jgi:hypothetical protein
MVRVSEYIASRLAELGVCRVFMLTGARAMLLNNASGNQASLQSQ